MTDPTSAQSAAPTDEGWHAPGIGEVHNHDHSLMIYCTKQQHIEGDQDLDLPDDDLARRVCAALSATPQAPAPTDERAAFEACMHRFGHDTRRSGGTGYFRYTVQVMWMAWQERAALSATPQAPADDSDAPLHEGWQVSIAHGHAGYGAYAHMTEYAEEGAVLLALATPPAPSVQAGWQHVANEWADMATNGIQCVRNIKDGISTPDEALASLQRDLEHCRSVKRPAPSVQASQAVPSDAVLTEAEIETLWKKQHITRGERDRLLALAASPAAQPVAQTPTGDRLRAIAQSARTSASDPAGSSELVLAGWKAAMAAQTRAAQPVAQTGSAS